MELLAPAGNVENFHTALESGADSVYIGAPLLNARNLARDLSLAEIGGMVHFAHEQDRKVYVAINSLVREVDLSQLIKTLAYLEAIEPDGLIVQDLGVINLVTKYFPDLNLHASTLMTAHNRDSIKLLSSLGCSRVVVARELTLSELAALVSLDEIEIEVFIHGAMCFSYSGLCLFSSYFGGKSGLRGKCVQPCRRKFSSAPSKGKSPKGRTKSGYLFSMNDLNGLELVPELQQIGVSSLKIEGRLRSANYVKNVVAAYRMVLDAKPGDEYAAQKEASGLVESAMGRKTSTGFFLTPQPKDAIVQHHSGNIGTHLGGVASLGRHDNQVFAAITLKQPCQVGERLRLHFEKSGERLSLKLSKLLISGKPAERAERGQRVEILVPDSIKKGSAPSRMEVYRVDVKTGTDAASGSRLKSEPLQLSQKQAKYVRSNTNRVHSLVMRGAGQNREPSETGPKPKNRRSSQQTELWLRYDSPELLFEKLPFSPDRHVLNFQRNSMGSIGRIKRHLGRSIRSVVWSLPPVAHESAGRQLKKNIRILIKSGFRSFQIANLGQAEMFEGEKVHLFGDYSLNLLNSQSINLAAELGLQGVQLAIEADRDCLRRAVSGYRQAMGQASPARANARTAMLGLTVYGSPALFTSRIAAEHFSYGRPVVSPKKEEFIIDRKGGYTQTRAKKVFSLLPYKYELGDLGLNYLVVDLSGLKTGKKEMLDIGKRIENKEKAYHLPTFNYLGTLE